MPVSSLLYGNIATGIPKFIYVILLLALTSMVFDLIEASLNNNLKYKILLYFYLYIHLYLYYHIHQ